MAVATAAIVCVLSVFNGFREVLTSRLNVLTPDITVMPEKGKVISDADSLAMIVAGVEGVQIVSPAVKEQALAIFGSREMPVTLKGVDPSTHRRLTGIDSIMLAGVPKVVDAELGEDPEVDEDIPAKGVASIGAAVRLGNPMPGDRLLVFAPRREGRINMANPLTSFYTDSIEVAGVFEARQSDFDEDMVIVPISTARGLLQYDSEASMLEVGLKPGVDPAKACAAIASRVGSGYEVLDRLRQQEVNFKMVSIEKWVSFLLLFFILVIASFNIISTMTMFVLDKSRSMATLGALGMARRHISGIFRWESVTVTLSGAMIGMAIGLVLCLLQQHYGFLKLSGDESMLVMASYPVKVKVADLLLIMVPVGVICGLTALVAGRFARRRITQATFSGMRR